jgi:DNA primase
MLQLGFGKEVLIKAGLAKPVTGTAGKEPYDVFRDRVVFPMFDPDGEVIAFSGRALAKETEPKYVNSPETPVFTKHSVLYGLDKAKEKIRRKDYAVLVEGQMDLVLSHQAGVDNTVASSGTAFTAQHLERLKRLSKRIILAFDGDEAGEKASDKSTELALSLGLEVKIAKLPKGKDPAELVKEDPQLWKTVLKDSKPAIEYFLNRLVKDEKDTRKLGKLIVSHILPKIVLLESSVERSHFVSLITKLTGLKEDVIWEDLKKTKKPDIRNFATATFSGKFGKPGFPERLNPIDSPSHTERVEERLTEVRMWLKEDLNNVEFKREEEELLNHLSRATLGRELGDLFLSLSRAETSKDEEGVRELTKLINEIHKKIRALDENVEVL